MDLIKHKIIPITEKEVCHVNKLKMYFKGDKQLTLKEYNRLAQQAYRKGIPVQIYIENLGWIKKWGNSTKGVTA